MDREVKRKILHATAAILAVPFLLLFDLVVGIGVALAGLVAIALVWRLESRGERLEGPAGQGQDAIAKAMDETMRPEESFPWAPFYFVGGLIALAVASELLQAPLSLAFAAYAILGIGDAVSALIGKAYGSLPIPWNREKSLEGTGAGLAAAYPWALMLGSVYHLWLAQPSLTGSFVFPLHLVWIVLAGTIVGMLVETLGGEDNLTIPVASWIAMAGLAYSIGLF
jgi:dolichol kinase